MFFSLSGQAQERCGSGRDLMLQALERIKTGSLEEAGDGLQLLKHANEECNNLGDAWYYRSLFERKLNNAVKADYSLRKAQMFGSEAMDQGLNPFVLAAPPESVPENGNSPVRQKWALLIGIGVFADTTIEPSSATGKDAKDFGSLLIDPQVGRFKPENVHTLIDADATTRHIKEQLNWLARSAQPDDLVVIFVSSHGSARESDTREVNYIVTSDTQMKPQDSLFATGLGMVELTQLVRSRILARRTAVFLDTCHSGAAAGDSGANSISASTLESIRQGVGRVILTASQEGERSYENRAVGNGYFTYFLLRALRDTHGMQAIDEVYETIRTQVADAVKQSERHSQHPVLSHSAQGGKIILGVPLAVSVASPFAPAS